MKAFLRAISIVIILCGIATVGYFYRNEFVPFAEKMYSLVIVPKPCTQPITYSIGIFDARFGLSKSEFLKDIEAAAQIWDSPLKRTLFSYKDTGDLTVNLIYDYRQQATAQMQSINGTISGKTSAYDDLKATYTTAFTSYSQAKNSVNIEVSTYNTAQASYDQSVSYWNSHGGAPSDEYAQLENERMKLNADVAKINTDQAALNAQVKTVNNTATQLNQLARQLNLNVSEYNAIGASTGPEFNEGEYISDQTGQRINIYQYENGDKLIRVLAHELGHALGLDHVSDPKAIMYYLNQASTETPTAADIDELKTVCAIK